MIRVPSRLLACTTIGFAPYSEKQLRDILTSKARAAGFTKYRCASSDTPTSKSKSIVSASALTSSASEMPATIEAVHGAGSDHHDFSSDLDAFTAIMVIALPQILTKTRHVGDLWETSMALWGYMFSASSAGASEFIRATALHDPSRPLPPPPPLPAPGSDSSNVRGAVSPRANERFQIDFKAVKMATQQILVMPATHVLKVQGPSRSRRKSRNASDSHVQHIATLVSMDAVTENRTSVATASLERRLVGSAPLSKGPVKRSLRCDLLQALPEDVSHFIDTNLRKCAMLCMILLFLVD